MVLRRVEDCGDVVALFLRELREDALHSPATCEQHAVTIELDVSERREDAVCREIEPIVLIDRPVLVRPVEREVDDARSKSDDIRKLSGRVPVAERVVRVPAISIVVRREIREQHRETPIALCHRRVLQHSCAVRLEPYRPDRAHRVRPRAIEPVLRARSIRRTARGLGREVRILRSRRVDPDRKTREVCSSIACLVAADDVPEMVAVGKGYGHEEVRRSARDGRCVRLVLLPRAGAVEPERALGEVRVCGSRVEDDVVVRRQVAVRDVEKNRRRARVADDRAILAPVRVV